MKNTNNNFISYFLSSGFILLLAAASAFAAPLVRTAAGANTTDLSLAMAFFRQDLGGTINPTGNSYTSGRREIDWEDFQYTSGYGSAMQFPYDYYNKIIPRGAVFGTAYLPSIQNTTMNVATENPNNPGFSRFRNINAFLSQQFRPFSGTKLFAPLINTRFDVNFYVPGTDIPATVNGFGAVFADVEYNSYVTFYDEAGKVIHGEHIPNVPNNGFSFVGVSFADGTRIARVDVQLGSTPLSEGNGECQTQNCLVDYAAMDNVIYGEPRAREHHASDFDGDGTADFAVFRPSSGTWYVMNSGSNTFQSVQFGQNGDVPVDGDFDGDARNDFTVFRPSLGTWFTLRSSNNQFESTQFGQAGDKPVAADYDKDGITDIGVWRAAGGFYYVLQSSDKQFKSTQWGSNGDIPIKSGF